MNCDAIVQIRIKNHQMKMDEKSPVLHPIITVSWQWRTSFLSLLIWRCPKFTFSTFTPDPNLQNPHLHKTQIYTNSNLHSSDLHTPKFTQPNIGIPKFTQLKFTPNWTQIYKDTNLHCAKLCKVQIYAKCKTIHQIDNGIHLNVVFDTPTFLGRMQVVLSAATPLTLRVPAATGALSFWTNPGRVNNGIHLI